MAVPSANAEAHAPAVLSTFAAHRDLDSLNALLDDPAIVTEALGFVEDPIGPTKTRRIRNLQIMIESAARAGRADLVSRLFAFAREHSVPIDELVNRHTVLGALSSARVDVVAELVAAQPSCVNFHLGHSGDPLIQAIVGPYGDPAKDNSPEDRVPLVRYLLEHGADPNASACSFTKPGYHLYTATSRHKPVEMIRLLLEHGAQISRTGAVVAAAEHGRVAVLELLLSHGADLNEALGRGIVRYLDQEKTVQRATERPIQAARRTAQKTAEEWLQAHGAEEC